MMDGSTIVDSLSPVCRLESDYRVIVIVFITFSNYKLSKVI